MFCDEKIIKVYLQKFKYDYPGAEFLFNCFDEIVFYATEQYKIVLETENRMLSIGVNGVLNQLKTDLILSDSEHLESDIIDNPYDDLIHMGFKTELFVGERLLNVEKICDMFFLHFDDFTMKVMPYKPGISSINNAYDFSFTFKRVAGCDRYIKRKCDCGGDGEILYKLFPGYVVRCKKCYKTTKGFDCLSDASNDWNSGKLTYKIDDMQIK